MRDRPSFRLLLAAPLLVAAGSVAIGCGDDEEDGSSSGGGSGGGDTSSSSATSTSSSSSASTSSSSAGPTSTSSGGANLTPPDAGIDGCDPTFVDDDGVCRPSLDKCPAGSVPDIDAGCVVVGIYDCDPNFVDDRGVCLPDVDDCEEGFYPVPTEGCVSIDGPDGCGAGTWGNVELGPDDLYVDASYDGEDADGSRERPFTTLAEALAEATDYRRIVLAAGTYTGAAIDHEVDIVGVCASQVTVEAAEDSDATFALDLGDDNGMIIAGLTVDDTTPGVVIVSGHVELSEVVVRHASASAILADGASASVRVDHVLVTDTTEVGNIGIGVMTTDGGTAFITRSAMIRTVGDGLLAFDGGTLTAANVFVAGTRLDSQGFYGGPAAVSNGTLTLQRLAATDNATGVVVYDSGSVATIQDCALGSTTEELYSTGIGVYEGATLTVTKTAVVDARSWGIDVFQSFMTGEHLLVADTPDGDYGGFGINLERSVLSHSAIVRTAGAGIGTGAGVTLTGIVVEDVAPSDGPGIGCGILVGTGQTTIERSFIRGFADFGVHSTVGDGTLGMLAVRQTLVSGARGLDDGDSWGIGIGASAANTPLTVEDSRIEDVLGAGIFASTTTNIRRVRVDGVAPANVGRVTFPPSGPVVGPLADGVLFLGGAASLELEDVWIEGAARAGVMLAAGDHELTRVRARGDEVGLAMRDGASAKRFDTDFSGSAIELEDPSPLVVPAAP